MDKCDFNCFECKFSDCILDTDSSNAYLDEAISREIDSFLFSDFPNSRYKRYYWTHKEKVSNRHKKYYQEHKEKLIAHSKAYYQNNKEVISLKRKKNKELLDLKANYRKWAFDVLREFYDSLWKIL